MGAFGAVDFFAAAARDGAGATATDSTSSAATGIRRSVLRTRRGMGIPAPSGLWVVVMSPGA
jgi:hypothetical protein